MRIKLVVVAAVGVCGFLSTGKAGSNFSQTKVCTWKPGESQQGYSCSHSTNREAYGSGGSLTGGGACGRKVKLSPGVGVDVGSCGQNSRSGQQSSE